MFLDYDYTVFSFHSKSDLLAVELAFWVSTLKIFKSLQTIDTGLQISQASTYNWNILQFMGSTCLRYILWIIFTYTRDIQFFFILGGFRHSDI